VTDWSGLKSGDTFHYSGGGGPRQWAATLNVRGGTTIAVDQDGRPALVANHLGKGFTLVCAYPLETYLANAPAAFDKEENSYRIYQAFRDWAGIKPRFRTGQPSVEATSLDARDHGYVIVVNHHGKSEHVSVASAEPLKSVRRLTPDGEQPVSFQGSQWELDLQPYGAAVFAWK